MGCTQQGAPLLMLSVDRADVGDEEWAGLPSRILDALRRGGVASLRPEAGACDALHDGQEIPLGSL
ncbi:hypothetical protein GCM10020221_14790 [Streptomyces thioluteus]|uniref:Uncharacterized protein n=1 Tax=Streptomyces thioluteus TaxID=66431 RepID=A0ABN3WMW6_STRTU